MAVVGKIAYSRFFGRLPILGLLNYVDLFLSVAVLCMLVFRRQWKAYWALGLFLVLRLVSYATFTVLYQATRRNNLHNGYVAYFRFSWMEFAVESLLALLIVYGVVRLVLQPFQGLLKVGTVIFSTLAVASELSGLGAAFGAHSGTRFLIAAISQVQRTQCLLVLGMLLFAFFAMRPMGISGRSRIFGVGLGLGVLAINDLAQSAWLWFPPTRSLMSMVNGMVVCAILILWVVYFALPEPERGNIDFRSPLRRWNGICLGWFA
jgi:hypothetical protein